MADAFADVVIVGGGIAGGALACCLARRGIHVALLERQPEYHDLVRGEMLSPWGLQEAMRLGVDDAVYAAGPTPLRRWIQWDEIYSPDDAPQIDLTRSFVPGVEGPLAIFHHETCERFAAGAAEAGADVVMAAEDVGVRMGPRPRVTYTRAGRSATIATRLVVGAGGRSRPVGRQLGLTMTKTFRTWGGGLAVDGLDEWPAGVQAMGTEGNTMFFVFPQSKGRARLYLNFPPEDRYLRSGPSATREFLSAFDLNCMPYKDLVLQSRPIGPCMTSPSMTTSVAALCVEGVVLIGDEAGSNDPVLGTGLSNGLRDARIVADILMESKDWSSRAFEPYVAERRERMARLNWSASVVTDLSASFGPAAIERRRLAWRRMQANPNYMVILMVTMAGPDLVPEFGFSDFLPDRLFAPTKASIVRRPRLR